MRSQILVLLTLVVLVTFSATVAGAADLVAYWTLDDGAGTNAVDSIGGFNGTLQGDPMWEANGKVGGALALDGDGDYVQTTLMNELHTGENFTVAAWFKTNVTAEGQQQILIWIGDVAGNGWGSQSELHMGINHFGYSNKVNAFFGSGADTDGFSINIVSKEDFTDTSDWHHLALAIKNASGPIVTGKLFLDGVWMEPLVEGFESAGVPFPTTDSTENPPDRATWNTELRIGSPGAASRYFNGMVDDVTIWNGALAEGDIRNLMTGGVATSVKPAGKLTTAWGALK